MPLIQTKPLPSFERLKAEGQPIIDLKRAESQDIRPIHVGILNMMQDAALEPTERQFLRLIGNSAQIVQIHVHLFTIPALPRGEEAQRHIDTYYDRFEDLKKQGLDALIITGANITRADITQEDFWLELCEIFDWADKNVTSVICACLAAHAAMKHFYGVDRRHMDDKRWGLFPHVKRDRKHPLMSWVNTMCNIPHSRHNDISATQFEAAGCRILFDSDQAGVHIATSPDRFRFIFVQGHLEYDTHSLLKEYKREVINFQSGRRDDYPPLPVNYFTPQSRAILKEYRQKVLGALESGNPPPAFPEDLLFERLFNTWRDTAKSFMNNWVGLVYQTTHFDNSKQYMDDIDPDDPLDIKRGK